MRQHRIRLLAHLIAVELQGVEVEQQGELVPGRGGEVPHGLLQEAVVLRVDAQLFVIGQVHRPRGARKAVQFLPRDAKARGPRGVDAPFLQQPRRAHGPLQVVFGAGVGVVVVVDQAGVLVGAGDAVDQEASLRHVPHVHPQACRFQQHLRALRDQVLPVAGGVIVGAHRIGDIAHDMILGCARQEIAAALAPVDGTPGIQRALQVPQQPRVFSCRLQRAVAVAQQLSGQLRHGEGEKGHHVHFRIPEVVPLVPLA